VLGGEDQPYGSDRDTVMSGNKLCGLPGEVTLASMRHRNVYIRVTETGLTARTFSRALCTSPLITKTVDAGKPFTYLRSVGLMADRIAYHIVGKAGTTSLARTTSLHLTTVV